MSAPPRAWPRWVLPAIFATVVATNAFDYSVLVPRPDLRFAMHQAIVDGTAPSPQRFRVLVPWALDPLVKALGRSGDQQQVFRRAYSVFHFLALTALVAGVYAYSRLWFGRDRSLIGALVIGTVLHLVLRMGEYSDFSPIPERSWFAPWSLLEPVFVSAGLILLAKRRLGLMAILTIVAAFNSEASIVLPLLALCVPNTERTAGLALLALWSAVSLSLRIGIGGWGMPSPTIAGNLAHLPDTIINLSLFLGPAVLVALTGFRDAPTFARRAPLALIPLLLAIAVYGDWWDVRLLTPVYPIIAPLLLARLRPVCQTDRPHP